MAIPLRLLDSPGPDAHPSRASMDSEASAILSYALGKHVDDDDQDSEIDTPRASSALSDKGNVDDEDAFFNENDPLTSDYEPFPHKQKSRRFRICVIVSIGTVTVIWLAAFVALLSKGYFLPNRAPSSPIAASRRITFDQVTNGEFYAWYDNLEWTSPQSGNDGTFLLRQHGQIIRANVNGTQEVIVYESDPDTHSRMTFRYYWISADDEYILLATNYQKNWRHSFSATYYVYHISSKTTASLIPESPNAEVDYAIWSPSQAKIAYVLEHDVYIRDMSTSTTERITYDGGEEVFNGVADWVFEEEVFASPGCLWWSPDSMHLAYVHINESLVPIYSIPYYIPLTSSGPQPYPRIKDIKYPKAGYPNPVIDVYVYTSGSTPWKITYPEPNAKRSFWDLDERDGDETDGWEDKKLITNVQWMGSDMLMLSETNRVSDHYRGVLVDVKTQTAQVVRDEKIEDGWFEISHHMKYIPADASRGRIFDGYIDVVDRDGYNHLGYFSPLNASTPQYITGGNWEVTGGIAAFDEKTNLVYFTSTKKDPTERHLYSVHLSGEDLKPLTDPDKEGYYSVSFSSLAQYYELTYNGPGVPYQSVFSTQDPEFSIVVENNTYLNDMLRNFDLPQYKYGTIEVDGYTLNYREIRPPNFDNSGKTKYPVLFHCYGGPVSQTVEKKYLIDWHLWITSEPHLEYLVVEVDGRGTGFMGRRSRAGIRGQLGTLESYDQAAAAIQWKSKPYVNPDKFAIWGWSFGGFLSLKTIESHPGVFPYAMAVAPVTDWRYYDSIYTERYMLTPHANPLGYLNAAIINTTAMGEARRFFIAHGTGDDNVHIQNSLALIDRLTESGVGNWDSQFFADDDHNIGFHRGSRAIHLRLAEWLERCFGTKEIGERIWKVDGELLGYSEGVDSD